MSSVIVFGPTGQVGSVAACTAGAKGARVWLAMRDIEKQIPGLTTDQEKSGDFHRVQADLQKPDTIIEAVRTSGAKRAFIYLLHRSPNHMKGALEGLKSAGIEFVVFLSSFTIPTTIELRDVPSAELIPYVHAQVEANLDDIFGSQYVAIRPGAFVTNLLQEKKAIAAGHVKLHAGGVFELDSITPGDIGAVAGNILVSGAKKSQKKVYLYGPEILSVRDSIAKIGETLNKDVQITAMDAQEAYKTYIGTGMPDVFAKYMVEVTSTKGPDKGNGQRFPNYEEGVSNVELYTGRSSTSLEKWVKANTSLFDA